MTASFYPLESNANVIKFRGKVYNAIYYVLLFM